MARAKSMILATALIALVAISVVAVMGMVRAAGTPLVTAVTTESRADTELHRRAELDRGVYALEVDAQLHERWLTRHWDAAREAGHGYASFRDLGFAALRIGRPQSTSAHPYGITVTHWTSDRNDPVLDAAAWTSQLTQWEREGYRVVQSEWHQPRFSHPEGAAATSTVAMLVHATNAKDGRRLVLRGKLEITWQPAPDPQSTPSPRTVDLTELDVLERSGEPAFTEVTADAAAGTPFGPYPVAGPVLVYDLTRSGLPDIVLGDAGVLLRNHGRMHFTAEPLCPKPVHLDAGVIGDFTGDGLPDLVGVSDRHVVLLRGVPGGRFSLPIIVADIPPIDHVQAITAGDVDGDGHLDLLIAQYLPPYQDGQMPTPYFDANDGLPSYLLINDGHGHFRDGTAGSGLEAKRRRRVFGASFVDLDGDGHPDLLVSSDFAGNDLYLNDGHGHFRDVSTSLINESHTFGMGHAVADFDGDGQLDLYLVGMSSTTARRLEAMHAGVQGYPEYQHQRPAMGYGNRMYLGQGSGRPFRLAPWCDQVARSGWSWGCAAEDFDNDGFPDLFIANGFVSAESSQDYCTNFWRHDIYTGSSTPDRGLNLFFNRDLPDFTKVSWNGYEHKVLYLNEGDADGGRRFANVAHLMDVAGEYDAREVVAADFDGDGHVDLLVVAKDFRRHTESLHLYRNHWPDANHWMAVRLEESPGGAPLPGSVVSVLSGGRRRVATVINGDSFMSQRPAIVHVGLGAATTIESLEVRWGDGQVTHIDHPVADAAVVVRAPAHAPAP